MPQRILQRPAASSATVPPPVFPPPQNAVVAPLVAQIHAHRQTVEIGAKPTSVWLFSCPRYYHLRIQFFPQFPHQLRQHFLHVLLHWPPRLLVGSLFFRELLCFFK